MNEAMYDADLVVLTADKNMKFAMQGLLNRPEALGIRSITPVFISIRKAIQVVYFVLMHSFNPFICPRYCHV